MPTDLVIDADGHCNEPWEDLTPWMPKAFQLAEAAGLPLSVERQRRGLGHNALTWFGLTPEELPNSPVYCSRQETLATHRV